MKHPQTWSISIACISSVMLAIGLAVVSASAPMLSASQTEVIDASIDVQNVQNPTLQRPSSPPLTTNDHEVHSLILSSCELDNSLDLNHLMEQVRIDMAELRMTSPKGNNAWEKLQLVLQQDAANLMARDTLHLMMASYMNMAKQAGNEGNKILQRHYLDQVHFVLYGGDYPRTVLADGFPQLNVTGN